MKSLEKQDPFKLGLIAFGVGILMAGMIGVISVVPFGKSTYTAVLSHTAGLKSGETVQISGVPVGTIRGVELAGDVVKVKFSVSKGIKLGSLTTGTVKVATLLGTHFLAIDPKGSGELANDTIPLGRTSVPYNLQDVLEKGNEQIQKLDAAKLAQMLTAMTNVVEPSTDDIGPALSGVAKLSDLVAMRSAQTGQLVTAARNVTNQLSNSSADLIGLMQQANLVISEVTTRRDAIHQLLVETTKLSVNLTAIVGQTRQDVQPALRNMNLALETLRGQDAQLRKTLTVMAPAMRYLTNASGNGPWIDLSAKAPAIPADDMLCKLGC